MRRRQGPSKRLAPSLRPETCCPHAYTEDDCLQLEVECGDCAGAHDLSNSKCLAGVVNVVCSGATPETIILKRYIHKRYRKDVVRLVAIAASELSSINRILLPNDKVLDKECRECAANKHSVTSEMKRRLLEDPVSYLKDSRRIFEDIRLKCNASACERTSSCVETAFSASTIYRS